MLTKHGKKKRAQRRYPPDCEQTMIWGTTLTTRQGLLTIAERKRLKLPVHLIKPPLFQNCPSRSGKINRSIPLGRPSGSSGAAFYTDAFAKD
jgi:hypothetical protein